MRSSAVFAAASIAYSAQANSTPIYGRYPGWTEGTDQVGIQIELFEDYLCSDCQRFNPVFEELLETSWLDGTVRDQVGVGLTPFPLPYHVHSYQVAQLVPYFMDLCDSGRGCYSNDYKDFSFQNLDTILGMSDTSLDDFTAWWSQQVATEFGLDETDVASCYSDSDPYDTDGDLRTLWKYATAKGVNGTPTAYVNGVKLDSVPMTVDGWLDILNSVYDSQYSAMKPKYPQS